MKRLWAVVPAAGAGLRLGGDIPKQYREVAGAPLMEHTLRALLQSRDICGVVVAMDPADPRADTIARALVTKLYTNLHIAKHLSLAGF